jgi:hypothetical protein
MFSWAQPSYCKTQEQYFVSKAPFMVFVASRQAMEVMGHEIGEANIKFAQKIVFPHRKRMVYFKHHGLFHLKSHINCGHEGRNNGMKHCATSIMPKNGLDQAVQILHLNAMMKAGNKSIYICHRSNFE